MTKHNQNTLSFDELEGYMRTHPEEVRGIPDGKNYIAVAIDTLRVIAEGKNYTEVRQRLIDMQNTTRVMIMMAPTSKAEC